MDLDSTSMVRNTEAVGAAGNFQILIRRIVVTDQASFVSPNRDGSVLADIPNAVQRADRRGGALLVRAVSNFQILVGRIIVTDEA